MKIKISAVVFCAVLFFAAGCGTVETGASVAEKTKLQSGTSVNEKELVQTGECFLHQIVAAMEKGDYDSFTENYIAEYRKKLTVSIFEQMSASFRKTNGKMKQIRYLGSVNKYSCRVLLWSVIFERTPEVNEQLKKAGQDPSQIPDTETLVKMIVGKTNQGWKIIQMGLQ
jgi:hypothetical protein